MQRLSSGVSSIWHTASGPSIRSSGTRGKQTVPSSSAYTDTLEQSTVASQSKNAGSAAGMMLRR